MNRFENELKALFKDLKKLNSKKSKYLNKPDDYIFSWKGLSEQKETLSKLISIHERRKEIFSDPGYQEDFVATAPNEEKDCAKEMIDEDIILEEKIVSSLRKHLDGVDANMERLSKKN